MFITFEGADGSGKTTQARRLADHLTSLGHRVRHTREPGGSQGAEEIRSLILSGESDRWSAQTEILLFTAARRDHLEKTIWPELQAGGIVVSDRFADSTRVYQGAAQGALRELVDGVHQMMIATEPDLTIVMMLDSRTGLDRGNLRNAEMAASGLDEGRFERKGESFAERLVEGFARLPEEFPDRCIAVDASGPIEEVFARVLEVVEPRLQAHLAREACREAPEI